MGSEWPYVSLKEITSKITKGTTPTKEDGGFTDEGINFIRAESVGYDGELNTDAFKYISDATYKKLKRSQLEENDILFSMAGAFLGKTALVRKKHLPANTNQALALIRPLPSRVDPSFLLYFLRQPSVVNYVTSSVSQSAQPNINLQEIGSLKVRLPSLNIQRRIANQIVSLDQKIELNRQMNTTLEAMAQALFKSWFVDFDPVIDNALAAGNPIPDELAERAERRKQLHARTAASACTHLTPGQPLPAAIQQQFPDRFVLTEEMGWVPEGWDIGPISHLAELNPEGWTPKNRPDLVRYVDLSNTKNGRINETVTYEFAEAPSRARRVLRKDDSIIGTVRPGNRSFAFVHEDGLTGSTGFAVMRPKISSCKAFIYLALTRDEVIETFAHLADGGAYPAIRPDVVAGHQVVLPSDRLLGTFDDLAYPWLAKIGETELMNMGLAQIRDTLLPKLLSGQLRIPEAEQQLAEVL